MSRADNRGDFPRPYPLRWPAQLTIDTPNSAKTLAGQGHGGQADPSRHSTERNRRDSALFNNNADEIFTFVDFAQKQLKKRINEIELRLALERRVLDLGRRQLANEELHAHLENVERHVAAQRSENVQLKKSIDVYKNQIYQANLEMGRLDSLEELFETRKWESSLMATGNSGALKSEHVDSEREKSGKKNGIRSEVASRERSRPASKHDTPHRQLRGTSVESGKPRPPKSGPLAVPSAPDDLWSLAVQLKREVSGARDDEEIVQKMGQAIDYFQFVIIDRILGQRKEPGSPKRAERAGESGENSLSRKFDFQSIRESSENQGDLRNSLLQNQFREEQRLGAGGRLTSSNLWSTAKPTCRATAKPTSKFANVGINLYKPREGVAKGSFQSFHVNSSSNFSFAGTEDRPGRLLHTHNEKKSAHKLVRKTNFVLPKNSLLSNGSRDLNNPKEFETHRAALLASLAPIPEPPVARNSSSELRRLHTHSRNRLTEGKRSLFYDAKAPRPHAPPSAQPPKPAVVQFRMVNYEEELAEKNLKFRQNVGQISDRLREIRVKESRGLYESIRRCQQRSKERSLLGRLLSGKPREKEGAPLIAGRGPRLVRESHRACGAEEKASAKFAIGRPLTIYQPSRL